MNAYQFQQQQLQMAAFYQQQQYDLAQQQAQLELQLQLEQMRLQNLALQEQIMLGQQAQAQAQADMQWRNSKLPQRSRFANQHLAERALARRVGPSVVAAPSSSSPAASQEDDDPESGSGVEDQVSPLRRFSSVVTASTQPGPLNQHHRRASSTGSYLSSPTSSHDPNAPTPALVLSKPGETFPTPASCTSSLQHRHTDSGSSVASTRSSIESFMNQRTVGGGTGSASTGNDTPSSEIVDLSSTTSKWRRGSASGSGSGSGSGSETASPRLNPCSTAFVPSSFSHSPPSFSKPSSPPLYRPGSSSSPVGFGTRTPPSLAKASSSTATMVIATRQPKGPPTHEADLAKANFSSRIRRRAVDAIRALGVRVTSPMVPTFSEAEGFNFSSGQGGSTGTAAGVGRALASPGLNALVAATRAREERIRQQQQQQQGK